MMQAVSELVVGSLLGPQHRLIFAQETIIVDGKKITRPVLANARCALAVILPRKRGRGIVKTYRPTRTCAKCGGECCKWLPGCAMPRDFGMTTRKVLAGVHAALLTGRWCLDWWEGDPRPNGKNTDKTFYFVRPAAKGQEGELYHGAWHGECTFLTDSGCELPASKRPSECKLLEPKPGGGGNCVAHGASKRVASIAWAKYGLGIVADNAEKERKVHA